MDKKQKENIKRMVGEGLSTIQNKLKISKPSTKMERALKKYAKKLADHFKAEVKRLDKKGIKKINKGRSGNSTKAKRAGSLKQKRAGK